MAKYVNISPLVEEIKKKAMYYEVAFNDPSFASYDAYLIAKGKYWKLLDIQKFIDTLEVKEIDETFEKEHNKKFETIRCVLIGWIHLEPESSFKGGFSREEIIEWLENVEQKPNKP